MAGLFLLLPTLASPAFAQVRPGPQTSRAGATFARLFVSVNAVTHLDSRDLDDTTTLTVNAEDARLESSYQVPSGPAFDVAGGAILWRNLGVAVGYTRQTKEATAAITASIPHPFFFNQPRAIEGEATGLTRRESGVHIQARVVLPLSERWQAMVYGGPTFFSLEQSVITSVVYDETYPYDEARFERASTTDIEESKIGVNVGADVAYFFTPQVGVGGMVQYSGTTMDLSVQGRTIEMKVGGVQVGGGLRLRF